MARPMRAWLKRAQPWPPSLHLVGVFCTDWCSLHQAMVAPVKVMGVWHRAEGKFLSVFFPEGLRPPQVWQLYKNRLVNSATPHNPFYGACCGNGHSSALPS